MEERKEVEKGLFKVNEHGQRGVLSEDSEGTGDNIPPRRPEKTGCRTTKGSEDPALVTECMSIQREVEEKRRGREVMLRSFQWRLSVEQGGSRTGFVRCGVTDDPGGYTVRVVLVGAPTGSSSVHTVGWGRSGSTFRNSQSRIRGAIWSRGWTSTHRNWGVRR